MNFIKKIIPQSFRNFYHLAVSLLANFWYGFPSKKIKVIGVTGTNGKTTTCQMITKILEEIGGVVAMMSTVNFKIGKEEWVNDTKYTTLSSFKIQEFIRRAITAGCEYIVIETSSHSLDQNRVWGIDYDVAVITNVTREHLDYHKTMKKYRQAKTKLFEKARAVMVNLDMENPEEFLQFDNKKKCLYTCRPEQSAAKIKNLAEKNPSIASEITSIVKAENIQLGPDYSKFSVDNCSFKINLPGLFNIENALAAVCVGIFQNISLEKISQALQRITLVPGRFERVSNDRGVNIIIDYAVTPDSLEKLYTLIKQINTKKTKVLAVFGACGERDRGKRPIMGEIVSQFADYVIVTNEDPYGEDPQNIINEVFEGVIKTQSKTRNLKTQNPSRAMSSKTEGVNAFRLLDRREAIKKALRLAMPGDFVIVTGKGAEETMAVGDERIAWNDKKVIQEVLQELK